MLPFGRAGLGAGTYCTDVPFVEDDDDDEDEDDDDDEEEELSLAG